jgi:transcriptional regulator with XRE-family HTH domain
VPGRGKTLGTVDLHVASRLHERRVVLGISQPKLAAALGLTFQQVHKYEHGKNRISAGRLYEFGKALGVPITFFFERTADALIAVTPSLRRQRAPLTALGCWCGFLRLVRSITVRRQNLTGYEPCCSPTTLSPLVAVRRMRWVRGNLWTATVETAKNYVPGVTAPEVKDRSGLEVILLDQQGNEIFRCRHKAGPP